MKASKKFPDRDGLKQEACCDTLYGQTPSDDQHSRFNMFRPALLSCILLLANTALDHWILPQWFTGWLRLAGYVIAFAPVGLPVLGEVVAQLRRGAVFSEFLLMTLATAGAFAIGEYPEGVAVMLFYSIGEAFQTLAVKRATGHISALLDQRPNEVTVLDDGQARTVKADHVKIGDIIRLKPGEQAAVDGELLSDAAAFNTAALTGESKPDTKHKGETVLAGMININTVALMKATATCRDSKYTRIVELLQTAAAQKAPTELFIHKIAKIYTPTVMALAAAVCIAPALFVADYKFDEWLYRALIFLVISCPCALVISIPLGYFGGVGAASRHGILIKGSHFLDVLASVRNMVMDKTGTLTEGVFNVQEAVFRSEIDQDKLLPLVNALESQSSHPVASAIHRFAGDPDHTIQVENVEEMAGYGLRATVNGTELLVGNFKLLDKYGVACETDAHDPTATIVAVACDRKYAGYLSIADRIKQDAAATIDRLKQLGVTPTMLSGDKSSVVRHVAEQLGIARAFGDLLPEDKVNKIKEHKARKETVAFVGDGVNDAPVVALSDVGIAMGGLGSDATIETADVVIQDDRPGKIPLAIRIGRQTKKIVWQNITLAFAVKGLVLVLGAGGIASMWEAVFADVGVALLAILNAVRIQRMKF
ncbi:MAG: cadmium-translocating P-type ATPase [Prevotellaceae bacterium]|jgi:Cd2+/Zn2+-exporting ATPase|nr:cadmium-translocating P-type ATPase [Prevotellaceae bacterium]